MVLRIVIIFVMVIILIIANAFANPIPKRKLKVDFKPKYGFSYSFEQANWYGLDSHKKYIEALEVFKPNWVRLPFFWDQMVDHEGNPKVEDLVFGIEEAEKRNIKIVIALGVKTPYFPETHFPESILKQVKFADKIDLSHPIAKEVLLVDEKLVKELSKYKNISHWQVENEPLLADQRGVSVGLDLIKEEIKIVRETDPLKRPVIVNHPAGWHFDNNYEKLMNLLQEGDVYSTNAYFKTQGTNLIALKVLGNEIKLPWPKFFVWPVQSWLVFSPDYGAWQKKASSKGLGFWIMEMQSEPYIRNLEDAKKESFEFNPSDTGLANNFLKSYEIDNIGLWGVHFWQFREIAGDNSWKNSVLRILN